MKERELSILRAILQKDGASPDDLLRRFRVSKRTLYYDIRNINEQIKRFGAVKNVAESFSFIGDYDRLRRYLERDSSANFFDPRVRQKYIVRQLLQGNDRAVDKLYADFGLSRNTRINDLHGIRLFLKENGFQLRARPCCAVLGDEAQIRNLFLRLLRNSYEEAEVLSEVVAFNNRYGLQLSDYSLMNLSSFVRFIRYRLSLGFGIAQPGPFGRARKLPYWESARVLTGSGSAAEACYLAAYISTLPNRDQNVYDDLVERYLDRLIDGFEKKAAVSFGNENREEFKKNIRPHMISLYRRLQFRFPFQTGGDPDGLNLEYEPLYKMVKSVIDGCGAEFPEFSRIGESCSEISYIAAYFGGFLANKTPRNLRRKKVVLVCPNGLTVSKTLQFSISRALPAVEIVDTIPISRLQNYEKYYDAIISTVELPGYANTVLVNPILTKRDVRNIADALSGRSSGPGGVDIKSILGVIEKNARIVDRNKLISGLVQLFYQKENQGKAENPMLKDLITAQRINVVQHVEDWKKAIELAARPLVEDHTIEPSYIAAMIDSVNQYGPYIVLDDYFALPHAKAHVGVNRLGMSLLVVKDEVDLLGKPVNVFLVLAAVDTTSHLNALGSLSDILCDRKNIDVFRSGDRQAILDLIDRY